ncbi:hypothetical protein QOZ80_9BG0713290 [Eleusine coracana subsp. coracana]|nr:hypothetical protein QOZ80_9BG0713290 [Eleusine coracana subsp. coracana]
MPRVVSLSSVFSTRAYSTATSTRVRHIALVAATEQVRSGNLNPADAHKLFDELLREGTPIPARSLNGFLAALARAPPSAAFCDGPTLVINLVSRMSHSAGPGVMAAPVMTYSILMDCCCRSSRPHLVLSIFARILRSGLWLSVITYNRLLKGLCEAKRTEQALDLLLRRTPDLGCAPDACSLAILLKSFCDNKRSQKALQLLQMMDDVGSGCLLDVVVYSTVIHGFFKEDEAARACDLFHEMIQRGIEPDVATYSCIIDALCKVGAMVKAGDILRVMVDKGVPPNVRTYTSLIHGYCTAGQWRDTIRVFKEMTKRGVLPDAFTWSVLMSSLCRHRRIKEARDIFDSMISKGHKPGIRSYAIMLHGYAREGCFSDVTDLYNLMLQNSFAPNHHVFNIMIKAYACRGLMDEAMIMFDKMWQLGLLPNGVTYSTVIDALCKVGRLEDAMEKFKLMLDQGGFTYYN